MSDLLSALTDLLGKKNVLIGEELRARDPGFDVNNMNAKALIRPQDTEKVAAAMRLCHEAGQPVVTHGGLTGAVQGTVPASDDVILSLERLNQIEGIDPVGRSMTVQAGVPLQIVQEAAEESDLIFPVDLGSRGSCTIGGNISTNAGGIQVIRYGMMRASVLGLEAVLADGRIISSMNSLLKNNSGYDLKQLFIGTEGTLGVVTRAVLRLSERPREKRAALVATDSFNQLMKLLQHTQNKLESRLGGFEVMWREYYEFATEAQRIEPPLPLGSLCYTIVEGLCSYQEDSGIFNAVLEEAFDLGLVADGVIAKSDGERESFWRLRDSFPLIVAAFPDIVDLDTSVPIAETERYVELTRARLRERFPELVLLLHGHLGDGNLHPLVCGRDIDPQTRHEVEMIFYEPLREVGGAVSAEHGIGIERRNYLHLCRSEAEIGLMQTIKTALDPKGILNPGKVLPINP